MQQLMEFAGNHTFLVIAFVGVFIVLIFTEVTSRIQGFKSLTPNEAVSYMNGENTQVIDVSTPADFAKGHIVGAVNVPLSELKDPSPKVAKMIVNPLLVTCKTGQTAGRAATTLAKMGASQIAVLKGGMVQWTTDNFPVTRK